MITKDFWDNVKAYIDAKTVNLGDSIKTVLDNYNWQILKDVTEEPLYSSIVNAEANALSSQLKAWESEAAKLTSESYAVEPYSTFVRIYTSDGAGGFPYTLSSDYSAEHWAQKAKETTVGISYQAKWTPSSGYPTVSATGGALTTGMMWVADIAEAFDSINWQVNDQLIRNASNDGWDRLIKTTSWATITNVPINVINALSTLGGTMTGHIAGFATAPSAVDLVRRDWVEAQVVNDLTTGGVNVPLSAEQGKALDNIKIDSDVSTITGSLPIPNIVRMSQASYDALGTWDDNVMYVLKD